MSEATNRAAIKTAIQGVAQSGNVHDYERWSEDWAAFLDHFKWGQEIRGWTITCTGVTFSNEVLDGIVTETFSYIIRGYFSLRDEDATEKTALTKVIEVRDALNAISTIQDWPQLSLFEARVFGNVLCHYTELTFDVTELI